MKRIFLFLSLASLALYSCSPKTEGTETKQISLDSLMHNYHEDHLKLNPLSATSAGDNRYNDQLPNTITLAYRQQVSDFYEGYKQKLQAIDRAALSANDQLSYDLLMYECNINLEGKKFSDHLTPISQIRSLTLTVAQLGSGTGNQPFKTVKDYDNWLSRLNGYLAWCDTAVVNMKKGMASGYTIPNVLAAKVITQLGNFDHRPTQEILFYAPIKNIPSDFSTEDKDRLTKAYTEIIEAKIIPTHKKMKEFIEKEYLPACRETSGIDGIPKGKEFYGYS